VMQRLRPQCPAKESDPPGLACMTGRTFDLRPDPLEVASPSTDETEAIGLSIPMMSVNFVRNVISYALP
jgi:hypothetical protein